MQMNSNQKVYVASPGQAFDRDNLARGRFARVVDDEASLLRLAAVAASLGLWCVILLSLRALVS